ncbi:hypothetical protein FUAX_04380 [Fulvitalea axinellae]|uniref:Capsule assembly protein Wzi n=1 Tax=Fulvitalea axinellae TaxID=1182444 RepID=A0AAU9D5C6_9BACT|nr:hypothetical protein FUAX_04380 [Fulvitalea axinellae]
MRNIGFKIILGLLPLFFFSGIVKGQNSDSLSYSVELATSLGTEGYLPHYLAANRWGVWDESENSVLMLGGISYEKKFGDWTWTVAGSFVSHTGNENPYREASASFFPHEYFTDLRYKQLYVFVGAKAESIGFYAPNLSTGSLGMSNNARPIPKIMMGMDYVSIPFTKDYIQFKGHIGNGWLEEDRHVSRAMIHEKSFFVKLGEPLPVSMEFGLVHLAQWGGDSESKGELPSDFSAFKDVFLGRSNSNFDPNLANEVNALGNHMGNIDFSLLYKHEDFTLRFYAQKMFEDNSGKKFGWEGGLSQMFLKNNKDGLFGLHFEKKGRGVIREFLVEYVKTDWQSGPGMTDPPKTIDPVTGQPIYEEDPGGEKYNQGYPYGGRDNYYNNSIYLEGWSYYGRSMGNPILLTRNRFLDMGASKKDAVGSYFVNNRVKTLHIGVLGDIKDNWTYKVKMTVSKNYGNYYGKYGQSWEKQNEPYYFYGGLSQNYSLLETNYIFLFEKRLSLNSALAVDWGKLSNNVGFMLGLKWSAGVPVKTKVGK